MENKIQELTDKIYQEGVEKGNEEAHKIIDEAKSQADKIIEDAKKEAESILSSSRKSAEELTVHTKSELKLFAGQAVDALKSEVTNLLTDKLVKQSVKDLESKKDFIASFVLEMAKNWNEDQSMVISTDDAKSLTNYFNKHAKDLLDKGVKIEEVNGIKTYFSISPADKSYKIDFGEEEFINYFKEFLRPQLIEMLF